MFGPTGVGVLYGRPSLLEAMPPYQGGGDMIASVTFEKTLYNAVPYKFEAGHAEHRRRRRVRRRDRLPDGDRSRRRRSRTRTTCSTTRPRGCARFPGARIIGEARQKTGVLSFVLEGVHPHDAGTILDSEGVAVRTGQHCAQPVMDRYGITATIRASLGDLQHARGHRRAGRARSTRVREVFALMSDLTDLYQEVILDHNGGRGTSATIETPSHHAEGYNPLCGDRLNAVRAGRRRRDHATWRSRDRAARFRRRPRR